MPGPPGPGFLNTPLKLTVPYTANISMTASESPASPIRLATNAFLAATAAADLYCQNPDQQVGGQAHALPPGVQCEVVVGEDQQHRGDEEVHVPEEAPPFRVLGHVYPTANRWMAVLPQ